MLTGGIVKGSEGAAGVFSACAVTCAMCKSEALSDGSGDAELDVPSLSDFPLSVPSSELLKEQQNYSSLREMFDCVLPSTVVSSAANSYFVQNGLFRKWVAMGDDYVGGAVFQLVVPASFV